MLAWGRGDPGCWEGWSSRANTPNVGHCLDLFPLQNCAFFLSMLHDAFGNRPHLPHSHFTVTAFTDVSSL